MDIVPPSAPPLPWGSAPPKPTCSDAFLAAYAAIAGQDPTQATSQPYYDVPVRVGDRYSRIRSAFEQYVVDAFRVLDDWRAIWDKEQLRLRTSAFAILSGYDPCCEGHTMCVRRSLQ